MTRCRIYIRKLRICSIVRRKLPPAFCGCGILANGNGPPTNAEAFDLAFTAADEYFGLQ